MHATPVALDARVSSAQHAAAQTLARQGAAWRERVAAERCVWPEAMPWLDDGERGAPWTAWLGTLLIDGPAKTPSTCGWWRRSGGREWR